MSELIERRVVAGFTLFMPQPFGYTSGFSTFASAFRSVMALFSAREPKATI
jgi:hypothetical protein